MPKIEVTIVPVEVGQLWDDILESVLNDVCRPNIQIPNLPLTDLVPHIYYPQCDVYHGKCHQQHTPNLCGYHATFNTLCFLNLIKKGSTRYNILNGASFWDFKKRVQIFLKDIKVTNNLANQWPWREQDILYGDFQRTYNKLCLSYFQDFEIFRTHQQFQLYSFTWEFQYQNLILADQKKRQLNQLINYFKSYRAEKPLILSFMLAITNHWMCLIVIKHGNRIQYWFFDSSNRQFLNLNHKEIEQYADKLDNDRKALKKQPYSAFYKKNMIVGMKDTQISLKLIKDCLQGRTTIDEYAYNQQFNIFTNQLEIFWQHDIEGLNKSIKEYWHNINAFFKVPPQYKLFTPQNARRWDKLLKLSYQIRLNSEEGKKLHNLLKRYDNSSHI